MNCLYDVLNKHKILNFHQIKGANGFRWAYRHFFGIDIDTLCNERWKENKPRFYWLDKMFDYRHRLIHGNIDTPKIEKKDAEMFFELTCWMITGISDEIEKRNNAHIKKIVTAHLSKVFT